jgi:hypothetical protein
LVFIIQALKNKNQALVYRISVRKKNFTSGSKQLYIPNAQNFKVLEVVQSTWILQTKKL